MAISTVKAKFKMLTSTGTATNLPGEGPTFILRPHSVRRVIREAKKYPESEKKVQFTVNLQESANCFMNVV